MKNNIIKYFLTLTVIFMAASCSDYLDVNIKPGEKDEAELGLKDLIAPVLKNTVLANYYAASVTSNYTQYFGGYGYTAAGESSCGGAWSVMYTDIFPNIGLIKEKAEASGAIHYSAIADIVTAINLSTAVELWGDVVYSQATQPELYAYPVLDDGKTVYLQALAMIDDAITALQATDNSGEIIGKEDMIYKGDIGKWLRAAYTYKARLQLKLMKNGGTTASDVLASINNGFTSNADNFMLNYVDAPSNNPYYTINVVQRSTSNYFNAPNDQLISLMNGSQYPFASVSEDPRLPIMFEKSVETDPWRGFLNGGTGLSSDGNNGNTFYKNGGYYTSSDSPLILITYAEAMFIKAEAAFLANGGTSTSTGTTAESYNAYLDGIQGHMDMLGADGTDYLADASVSVGVGNLALHNIMREKYIANFHSTETYNDFRRYNFSSDVFTGLDVRIPQDEDVYAGLWFRRAYYPENETNSNDNIITDESSAINDIWLFE
ncbi:SusD/RagB family nutrient-binding outer membrane lipoprotein [Aestuariibaculum sp. M13]|uniref:SusD/RagB family nutrient-binding outer membrane lipoprotein n=1 Tax=Aestuariibaculum sp. M13 TaxID=2967132 RepID=UPI002159E0E9|nr:SusD/RagB family nutrient-binding outer membrane lipoprotein [Aestuariibaculum sp. M13]MCR8667321.1 SusD/RagB family nutrient-binding outer membrane lipoprotein [Aestuariibaculum sp. M13]